MARIGGPEVDEAHSVLQRAYYAMVHDVYEELVRAYYDGEIGTEDELTERLEQDTDSALTYTGDQALTLYISDKTDDGLERMRDMGYEAGAENFQAIHAVLTLQEDVRALVGPGDNALFTPLEEGLDETQRLVWLAAQYTSHYLLQEEAGAHAFLVGKRDAGDRTEVALGVVLLQVSKNGVMANRESAYHYFAHRYGKTVAGLANVVEEGEERHAWRVLQDALLDRGLQLGLEPTFDVDADGDHSEASLTELLRNNMDDAEIIEGALTAKAGGLVLEVGGGAAPLTRITRVR